MFHPVVVIGVVQKRFGHIFGFRVVLTVGVAQHGGASEQTVAGQEKDDDPCNHLPQQRRNLFNALAHGRIQHLDPCHSQQSPENAVQHIGAAADVQGHFAVVPEHRAEYQLGEHAAKVLISAADDEAREKDPPVGLVRDPLQGDGQHHRAKTPHEAEAPVQHAGAAHPLPRRDPAEDHFDQRP